MSFLKSFLINDSELTTSNYGSQNSGAVFKDHDGKKYLKDPFNPLIKDDLIYHHNIRVYRNTYLNPSKTSEADMNAKDHILAKKGILRDKIVCLRPHPDDALLSVANGNLNVETEYNDIKFNVKIFCLNYRNDLLIERNLLAADLVLDENISIENTLNKTIFFVVDEFSVFQNTNVCFITVKNISESDSDLKALFIYDLKSKQVLETVTDFKQILFFDNSDRKYGLLSKKNKLSVYKIKNNRSAGIYIKRMKTVHSNFQIPVNKGFFYKNDTFLCISDKTEGQIINFELPNILTVLREDETKSEAPERNQVQMDLFPAHKSTVYNVALSKSTKFILTSSRNGTAIKLFIKTINENKRLTCPHYQFYAEFKRGMEKTLNYVLGFSNDEKVAFCLSFKRTLHFYLIPEPESEHFSGNKHTGYTKSSLVSVQTLKLANRITDDVCNVVVLKSSDSTSQFYSYNVYIIWQLSGLIELYELGVSSQRSSSSTAKTSYCKKLNWVLLY